MPNKLLIQEIDDTPKQIAFADHANDFAAVAANDLQQGMPRDVEIQLASLANSAYRQSPKFDFGEHRAERYNARGAIEFAATPTDGETVELYLSPSHSSTAGNANSAGASGANAAYTGYSSDADDAIKQAILIGIGTVTDSQVTPNVQIIEFGEFSPPARYGSLIVRNESGAAFHSDDAETHVVFDPIVPELQ